MNGNPEVRFAFKLKSSNNEHYRVNPVFGFVEPGAAAEVEVIRYPGPPKGDDKLEICFRRVPMDVGDANASSLLDLLASSRSTFLWLLHEYDCGTMDIDEHRRMLM